jgi:hypothetical protein
MGLEYGRQSIISEFSEGFFLISAILSVSTIYHGATFPPNFLQLRRAATALNRKFLRDPTALHFKSFFCN